MCLILTWTKSVLESTFSTLVRLGLLERLLTISWTLLWRNVVVMAAINPFPMSLFASSLRYQLPKLCTYNPACYERHTTAHYTIKVVYHISLNTLYIRLGFDVHSFLTISLILFSLYFSVKMVRYRMCYMRSNSASSN